MFRFGNNIFIRNIAAESVVWCPRTGGCTILRDAQPILEEVKREWRGVNEIVRAVAEKFGCDADEVRDGVEAVVGELVSQKFVEVEGDVGTWKAPVAPVNGEKDRLAAWPEFAPYHDEDWSPLGDFYMRHGLPNELHIDLTDACTERCVHCYVPRDQNHFLPYELAKKAIHEFRDLQGFTVHITGGECMLHPDFEHVCELCKSLNVNIVIFSNLTCCDARRIAFLREIDPQFINVSLYSMNPAEHDAITQLSGSWNKTLDTLLACEKAGVHCRIATPLLKINRNAFPELKKFADAHHMHLVPSADIIAQSDHGCGNLASACSADEMRCVMKANRELFNQYDGVKMPTADAKVCDIGSGRLYLNSQGNYYPCDSMHGYVLGNVRENTFEEVWRGEKLEYLRGLKNKDFGACAICEDRPWCKVCPAANFNATRDLFTSPSGHCEFAKAIREVYGKDN